MEIFSRQEQTLDRSSVTKQVNWWRGSATIAFGHILDGPFPLLLHNLWIVRPKPMKICPPSTHWSGDPTWLALRHKWILRSANQVEPSHSQDIQYLRVPIPSNLKFGPKEMICPNDPFSRRKPRQGSGNSQFFKQLRLMDENILNFPCSPRFRRNQGLLAEVGCQDKQAPIPTDQHCHGRTLSFRRSSERTKQHRHDGSKVRERTLMVVEPHSFYLQITILSRKRSNSGHHIRTTSMI